MTVPFPKLERGLVAILRGLRPEEAVAIGAAIFEAGIHAIEVPLNSPQPFESIAALVQALPKTALIGAGTVLTEGDVDRLHTVGGRLLVSPNIDAAVMRRAATHRMVTMPGVFSPTEALAALQLGASALKFFPASVMGPKGIAAVRAVLPAETVVGVVGGVSEADFPAYAAVGVRTFGLGSSLYRPGDTAAAVGEKAQAASRAWDSVFADPR
jgi:2-dehydro-3-deoxyphosphogalactonate aldolase